MKLSEPTINNSQIRTVNSKDIDGIRSFYELYAHEPLIVKGVFPPDHPLHQISLKEIENLFAESNFDSYDWTGLNYQKIPASEFLSEMYQGISTHNIVDHHIVDTPLGSLFETPSFLSFNWFIGEPMNRDFFEKSLILSPKGSFTSFHLDAYGMEGWMYLIKGCKMWEFYSPKDLLAAFDPIFKEFFDPRKHRLEQFPFLTYAKKYVGKIEGGDLIYIPTGWIHQVETTEMSFGVGGNLINDYNIEENMRWWLWESTLNVQGTLDLKEAIVKMSPERYSSPEGQKRGLLALQLYESWEKKMREINAL